MLNELDILHDVTDRLEIAGIDFMLTGSMAMNFYAEPRMTRDIDIVIAMKRGDVDVVLKLFRPKYYISEEAIVEALQHQSMFNIIHTESVVKVDFVVRKSGPFRTAEFKRRRRVKVNGFETWIVSREDLILSKLEWMRDAFGSELQKRDILNLLDGPCDMGYVRDWAGQLNLTGLLEEVTREGHQ